MKKGLLFLWVCFAAACASSETGESTQTSASKVVAGNSAQVSQQLASQLLAQYLQMKSLFPQVQDTATLHGFAAQMKILADSLSAAASQLPSPINDSVATMSLSLSDELNALGNETDTHEIDMAFQVSGIELFQLLRWVNYSRVTVYKKYDANCLFGRGGEWLDILRNGPHPFASDPNKSQYQITDSIKGN